MPSPHRQLQKAIRIRQFQEGEPNNETGTASPKGLTYEDRVLADQPVFAYILDNVQLASTYNLAERTADGTNNGTLSSDVYDAPPLTERGLTRNVRSLYFDCDATTGRPYVEVPWFADRACAGTDFTFECLFSCIDPTAGTSQFLFCNHNGGAGLTTGQGYRVAINDNALVFGVQEIGSVTQYTRGFAWQANTTYHIAITVQNSLSGTVEFFVNGTSIGTQTLTNFIATDEADEGFIGALNGATGVYGEGTDNFRFNGQIQAVCQYDKILTQTDITNHYEALENQRQDRTPAVDTYKVHVENNTSNQGQWQLSAFEQGNNNGFIDVTGNGNDGVGVGTIQETVSALGSGGNSSLFLPTSTSDIAKVRIPYSASLVHGTDSSVMAFVAPTKSGSENYVTNIIYALGDFGGASADIQYRFQLNSLGDLIVVTREGASFQTYTSTIPIPDYTFDGSVVYHVACTVSETNNEIKFYLNGEQLGDTIAFTGTINNKTAGNFYIGNSGDTGVYAQEGFHGFLKAVSYHSTSLTAQQILAAYSLRGAYVSSNLDDYVARWSFDNVGTIDKFNDDIDVWWEFNSNINETIDTKFVSTGGGGSGYVAGVENLAIDMNGTNNYLYISAGTLSYQEFAVKIRFKLDAINRTQALVTQGNVSNTFGFRFIINANNSLRLFVGDGTNTDFIFSPDNVVTTGVWYEAIASFSPTGMSISLDGVEQDSKTKREMIVTSLDYTGTKEVFGALYTTGSFTNSTSYTWFLDGQIDDIKFIPRFVGSNSVPNSNAITNTPPTSLQKGAHLNGQLVNVVTPPTPTTDPTDYVSFWDLGADGSDATGTNNGTLVNAPLSVADRNNNAGGARDFNGTNQRVDIPTSATLNTAAFTISAWIKTTDTNGGRRIFSNSRNNPNTFGYTFLVSGTGKLGGGIYDGTGFNVNEPIESTTVVTDDRWHYVVLTYDGTNTKVYVDGILEDTTTPTASIAHTSSQYVRIACQNVTGVNTNFLDASLDDVKFYDRALTEGEVAAQFLVDRTFGGRIEGYDGTENGALSFNGITQHITLPDVADLKPTVLTATGWCKATNNVVILANYYDDNVFGGSGRSGFRLSNLGGIIASNTGFVTGVDSSDLGTVPDPRDGNWHHHAMSYNGTTLKYYLDGVLVQSTTFTGGLVYQSPSYPAISARYNQDGNNNPLLLPSTSKLDDVRLYDRVLTSDELSYLYSTTIPPKPQDMIGEWKFESNGNDSVGSKNLTVNGTPSYISGWEGNCADLGGLSDYFALSNADSGFAQVDTFSVSLFLKASSASTNDAIVNCEFIDASNNRFGWRISIDSTNRIFYTEYNGTLTGQPSAIINETDKRLVKDEVWIHLCATRTPSGSSMYIDGELVLTRDAFTIDYTDTRFTVGARHDDATTFGELDGQIDELRFYNRELTQDEVKALALRDAFAGAVINPETPPPPPTYNPLVLDIDVASITEQVANGTGISYTSQTLTATVTGGSGQFDFAWTTDEPRLVFILGADGFDQSATVNTNAFNILNGSQETVSGIITCTVTDTGNGNATTNDTCTVNITFGTTNDYIAYWNGDSSSVTGFVMADQTTNNHDATFVATPTFGTGVDGNSVLTDTGQYADVTDDAALKTTSFSFACWMKPSATNTVGTLIHNGVNLGSLTFQGMYISYANASDQLTTLFALGTGSVQGTDFESASSIGTITEGDWNHVCVTYDNAFIKLYVNGVERANVAWANGIAWPQANNIRLGAQNLGSPAFSGFAEFDGELDEMKWWDRRLTAAEVSEVYNLEGTPSAPPAPFEVTISPSGISDVIFPIAPYTSQTITATPANGSGSYTYQWAYTSQQSANFVIDNPTSATTTISSTGESAGEYIDTLQVTVTDTGNGNVQVTDSITVFTNWGAV